METVVSASVLRARINFWRRGNQRVALVPTMGNLHAGHLRLVERARELAERVVVSCFVNPMQFGPGEDFEAYPRTLEADQAALDPLGVDLFFVPDVFEMYPGGHEQVSRVEVPDLADRFCGAFRPGHFTGVATVVAKLFNLVQPDSAVFGCKDYQQLVVIRRMVQDLCWPIEVVGMDTIREKDGLAMSSRNQYLTDPERVIAPKLFQALQSVAKVIREGSTDFATLETGAMTQLAAAGFDPEYFRVVNAVTLEDPEKGKGSLIILTAANLGKARLIDNLLV